jgi:hypothetical protein
MKVKVKKNVAAELLISHQSMVSINIVVKGVDIGKM